MGICNLDWLVQDIVGYVFCMFIGICNGSKVIGIIIFVCFFIYFVSDLCDIVVVVISQIGFQVFIVYCGQQVVLGVISYGSYGVQGRINFGCIIVIIVLKIGCIVLIISVVC